ncbi:fibronectin type III domain-containing protein [Kordia sp. YSTF-M3]|uniref:Fibronectin type III domain-containing protein n=1 Tax=Kordia aestuariivivens TaxID=2759037 RepID=A0ABR7QC66_9FLAO|nr:T9SS type A sorting domain-containing protein [Kordia aestuariivivens]MBC8756176.1 fibronectin type III domain-containing protein [Kordia aestuariivivens]
MKKITLKIFMVMFLLGTYIGVSQTLNQAASWPNANWTLSGTFTAGGLLSDPTVAGTTFTFDDDAAGNGSADDIQATSPVIDLTAANGAGETWITISGDFVYRELGGDVLNIEIYDADAMTWSAAQTFAGNSTNTDFQTCAATAAYTTAVINIAGYTATQLSGFQYRFTYDDQGGWQWGWCLTSPTIVSAAPPSCPDPSALTATNIDGFSADLGWTEAGSATLWNVELVDITGGGTVTGTATATGVANPYMATGLTPSNNYEYYVQADCGGSTSAWVGPFAFSTTVACPAPSALTATNILTTTADLGWTAGAGETLWDVEIVDITAAGVATGTPTASGVANPYGASGLTPNNNYEFYVRADCAANGTSTWVGPFAFTTACTAFTAPYSEDFENAGVVPSCWTLGGDENWLFNTAGPNHVGNGGTITGSTPSGNFYAVVDDSTPDAANAELTSPFVDVSGLTTPALIFYEISNNEGNPNATLTVSVWDGAMWNVVGTYNTNTVAGWEQKVVDLSGLTFTGDAQVRFSVADSGSFYDDIAIDDVSLEELPSCPDPSTLTATAITDTTADLGWTETGSATLWNVELVDVTAGGTVTGTATATGVANPYMATGLTENNNYEFYVQSDCGPGGTSNWVGPFAFTTLETCPTPSALTATNIMETSADLGWTENGVATLWNIELVDITAGGTQTMTPTASGVANPYAATGLVGDNSYQFYVQADCGVDGTSAWAGPFSFATPYVAVPPDCTNGIFLDSGGASGDYSAGENITYTICPDNPATQTIEVEFTAFSTENNGAAACYDGLTIHDGPDALSATIDPPGGGTVWCWDLNDTPAVGTGDLLGMMIESTDPSGCLTFVFTSDGSVQRSGWEAMVNCNPLSTISFENGRAFTFYPNPVDNKLTLVAGKRIENVTFYNILGAQVLTTSPNALSKDVDTSALTAGTYFVQVTVEGVTDTIKIIKQ